jgi:hypothetical protein
MKKAPEMAAREKRFSFTMWAVSFPRRIFSVQKKRTSQHEGVTSLMPIATKQASREAHARGGYPMRNARKKSDVLAVGPVFDSKGRLTSRRVVLVKQRNDEGDTKEYVIINRKMTSGGLVPAPGQRKRTTHSFTHAVRMFCDNILEQAWRDDLKNEQEAEL